MALKQNLFEILSEEDSFFADNGKNKKENNMYQLMKSNFRASAVMISLEERMKRDGGEVVNLKECTIPYDTTQALQFIQSGVNLSRKKDPVISIDFAQSFLRFSGEADKLSSFYNNLSQRLCRSKS